MSRVAIPLRGRKLPSTGDVLLSAELHLLVRTAGGVWVLQRFLVDTGSEIATFPAEEARRIGLAMPINPASVARHIQTGLPVRSGLLRFQVVGMDQTEYAVPCFFLGDPHAPYAGPAATAPRKLFQPLSVTTQLRFTFDDPGDPALPHGEMVIEKK